MTMKIKTLIVDDIKAARDIIKKNLEDEPDFVVVGESSSGEDAVRKIISENPDLVFLDIQMPEVSGFDVIEAIDPEQMPCIIFVTAYDEYAIKAFEVNAVDYLLKPFYKDRFKLALNRAKEKISSKHGFNEKLDGLVKYVKQKEKFLNRIIVKNRKKILFVKTEKIMWIEAAVDYVYLHTETESYLINNSIKNLEESLDPSLFVRIHRSYIVNMDFFKEILHESKNSYSVVLNNGVKLNISRKFRENILNNPSLRGNSVI